MTTTAEPRKRPTMPAKDDPVLQELQGRYRELKAMEEERQIDGGDLTADERADLAAAWKAYMEHICLRGELGGF